jgi:hypothetical protein
VALRAGDGGVIGRSGELAMPRAVTRIGAARVEGGRLWFEWTSWNPVGGGAPPQEPPAVARGEQRGLARVDLTTGAAELLPARPDFPVSEADQRAVSALRLWPVPAPFHNPWRIAGGVAALAMRTDGDTNSLWLHGWDAAGKEKPAVALVDRIPGFHLHVHGVLGPHVFLRLCNETQEGDNAPGSRCAWRIAASDGGATIAELSTDRQPTTGELETIDGRLFSIVAAAGGRWLSAVDLASGSELWRTPIAPLEAANISG